MTRIRATVSHFLLSLTIVSVVLTIVLFLWYPPPYFQVFNATDILRVLIAVDLVLGPLLTLVLFKPGKKGLVFDMCCVAALQIGALVYGLSVIYQERPYFAVFAHDRFEVLPQKDVVWEDADRGDFMDKPWGAPIFVVALVPTDIKRYNKLIEESLFEGKPDIERRPEFWIPYEENTQAVLKHAKPLQALLELYPEVANKVSALEEKYHDGNLAYVPVRGKTDFMTLVIDKSTTRPIDIIGVDPLI